MWLKYVLYHGSGIPSTFLWYRSISHKRAIKWVFLVISQGLVEAVAEGRLLIESSLKTIPPLNLNSLRLYIIKGKLPQGMMLLAKMGNKVWNQLCHTVLWSRQVHLYLHLPDLSFHLGMHPTWGNISFPLTFVHRSIQCPVGLTKARIFSFLSWWKHSHLENCVQLLKGCFTLFVNLFYKLLRIPFLSFSSLTVTLLSLVLEEGILWIPSLLYSKIMLYLHLRHMYFGPFPILNELVVSHECLKMDFMSNVEWVSEFSS